MSLSSCPPHLKEELERRIKRFEEEYEAKVFNKEDAMIPRIKAIDYIVVAITGIAITLYLVIALVSG